MATLSGQTIQSTYPGLLKLSNSTSGVTVAAQAIEDGYGNDTGVKLGTNYLTAPNILNWNDLKNDYYGPGVGAASTAPAAGIQNLLIANPFYDNGMYSYSAICYNVATATTIGDTVEGAFYTTQQVNGIGIGPYEPIMTGITITTNSTGFKEQALPSTLSFSAYGPGIYWFVYKYTNSGATPTVRYFVPVQDISQFNLLKFGFTKNKAGTNTITINKGNQGAGRILFTGATTSFPTQFSSTDLDNVSSTSNPTPIGFALGVTRP